MKVIKILVCILAGITLVTAQAPKEKKAEPAKTVKAAPEKSEKAKEPAVKKTAEPVKPSEPAKPEKPAESAKNAANQQVLGGPVVSVDAAKKLLTIKRKGKEYPVSGVLPLQGGRSERNA